MLTKTLSTAAYSVATGSVDNNFGTAAEVDRRVDAECQASTRNGSACWTVGDVSGRIAEPEAVVAFQRVLAAVRKHAQCTCMKVLSDGPRPIDRSGTVSIVLPEDTHQAPLRGFSECRMQTQIGPLHIIFVCTG
ncbi:unnamed protein product [Phytophthora fragariaefolia]|uniref:Unnamed protein product n=1 Tax=Phytophthora fragariaefolia TaxID=1490495 RepID=A0A9W7D0K2_9STRA|nr:unnamed protein product [Phytophthora fragariaefolia]